MKNIYVFKNIFQCNTQVVLKKKKTLSFNISIKSPSIFMRF